MKNLKVTVSGLITYIANLINKDIVISLISVIGEVSNVKYHSNGNIYFSIKENDEKIDCILFSSNTSKLKFEIKNGMKIICSGSVKLYTKNASCTLYVNEAELEGKGDILEKFLLLKEEFQKKGYFDEEHKKKIPFFSKKVGIITSGTGAALTDILRVHDRKRSISNVIIYPSLVQGENSPKSIIAGIDYFNSIEKVDTIILARGGGSMEDLWGFNDRELASAIFNSEIPIICGIGHEIDFTIADFVCDKRAATPSIAAEIAFFSRNDAIYTVTQISRNIKNNASLTFLRNINMIEKHKNTIERFSPQNKLINKRNRVIKNIDSIDKKVINKYIKLVTAYERINNLVEIRNPSEMTKRNYIKATSIDGNIISSKKDLLDKKEILLHLKDGVVLIKINSVEEIDEKL